MFLRQLGTRSIRLTKPSRRAGGIARAVILLLAGCGIRGPTPPSPEMILERPPVGPAPLDQEAVIRLFQGNNQDRGVPSDRLIYLAQTQCLNFFITSEIETDWRQRGMKNATIAALGSVCVNLAGNDAELGARRNLEQEIGPMPAAEQYHAAAREYMDTRRFGAAEGEIWQAIRAAPTSPHRGAYYFLLGLSYYNQQKCDRALRAFESATQLDRSRKTGYLAYLNAGHCFQLGGEMEKARDAYQRAYRFARQPDQQKLLDERVEELRGHSP